MDDIDYHSIYTQFLSECNKKNRPPAIITKGFLGKTSTPTPKIDVYYLVPSVLTDNVVKSIIHNSNHPAISKFKLIKRKDQTLDKQLRVESIDYAGTNGITYADILRVVDSTAINIILCDSVLLDYHIFDYIHHVPNQTLAVLSSRKFKLGIPNDVQTFRDNSEYTYDIDNFNGFIFYGKPEIDVPYYANFYGSKHMFIKKLYTNKFNVVNVSTLIPCYMLEYNSDYLNKDNSYVGSPSFSIVIVQPQTDKELTNVIVDEKDIFKHRDAKPIDTAITFSNIQTDVETILPLLKRIDISELEHTIKINLFQLYQREFERKQKIMVENCQRQFKEINSKVETEREKQKETIEKELKVKTNELHEKYESMKKEFELGFNALKEERMQELDRKVENEYELMRSQRIVSIDIESKSLFQALDTQYNELLEQRKERLKDYERSERDRIDNEIQILYSDKYDEVSKKMELRKMQLEDEIDKSKEEITNKIKGEVRSEYILKYNDEYAIAISQMNKFIEYRRNAAVVNIDSELESLKERKHKEIDAWEKIRHATIDGVLKEYESQQKTQINSNCDKYQKARFEDIDLLVEHKYTIDCESNKRKIDEERETIRMNAMREANDSITKMLDTRITTLNAEIDLMRNEQLASTISEIECDKTRLLQNMNIEVEQHREKMLTAIEVEASDLVKKLADDRETIICQIMESNISFKESEITAKFAFKEIEAEKKYSAKIAEAEKDASAKILQLQKEFENARNKEDLKITDHECYMRERLLASEGRIKQDAILIRNLEIERECANKRNEMSLQLNTEFENKQNELKKYIEKLKESEILNMKSNISSNRLAKERELNVWFSEEKHKLDIKLKEDHINIEKSVKEYYELKKFEYAESFTSEVSNIEKSRIAFHNREIDRINKEVIMMKQSKVVELTSEIVKDLNKRLDEDLLVIRDSKMKELISEVQSQAHSILTKECDECRTKMMCDLENEISLKRQDALKIYEESIQPELIECRTIALSKLENEINEYKINKIKDIDSEIHETERKRRAKIREMQEIVHNMN